MRLLNKLHLAAGIICCVVFTGCFEVEEKTTFTNTTSGEYALTVDMSDMLSKLKMFGAEEQLKQLPMQDTTVMFAAILSMDTVFSSSEKETLSKGSITMQMNKEENLMKFTLSNKFTTLAQLNQSRDLLFKILMNTGKGSMPGMDGFAEASAGIVRLLDLKSLGIVQKAEKGLLTQTVANATVLTGTLQKDSSLQQIQQMTALIGAPIVFKHTFNFQTPVADFKAANGTLSSDKKSLSIRNTLEDLIADPSRFEYRINF